ncbi:glycoside hydrolase family 32 protein [uncultured Clostridium sp.]|uniref:glycoside hydrolase family 32 protein n=1 Tax=uncultured Clostridium sp. TaxID=59620 RepID=UPI0025E4C87E|nr:glycoside hydrolase family 32 protein [uncultured Clostridium sp.]
MNRPKIHFTTQRNWINDPNGFVYYKGEYHLFYQYFPYDTEWGTMHWGHATSKDLVNFEHHPIAIFPSKQFDRNGCFSGTALIKDDKLHFYYTGIKYLRSEDENIHKPYDNESFEACQVKISSEDGYTFDNFNGKKVIIPPITDAALGHVTHTRDPKVWKYKNGYSMILGSKFKKDGVEGHVGEALFYTSKDGETWEYKNRCFDETLGDMWECPDLINVDGKYIFIMSPEHITDDGVNYTNNSIYSIVDFDEETCEMKITNGYKYLDEGLDLYAPQTTLDKDGNRIVIGWVRMPKKFDSEEWIGMMTLPRVINVIDNKVHFTVPDYIQNLFNKEISVSDFNLDTPCRIKAKLTSEGKINIGGYKIYVADDRIVADRSEVFVDCDLKAVEFKSSKLDGRYDLDIFIDKGIIEIFINDGQYVITNVVYYMKPSVEYDNVCELKMFEMKHTK